MNVIKLRVTSVNPVSGRRRMKLINGGVIVAEWLESQGLDPSEVVRGCRMSKNGGVSSFACGSGYDVLSADLLGGTADGRALRAFEEETGYTFTRV